MLINQKINQSIGLLRKLQSDWVAHKYQELTQILAIIIVSIVIGLVPPLLSPESWLGVGVVTVTLSAAIGISLLVYAGATGRAWAITVALFFVALAMEGTLRRRELTASNLDAQTMVKLLIWAIGLAIGVANHKYVKKSIIESPGIRWLFFFSVWALLSTTYSSIPAYTFGGGFAFLSLILIGATAINKAGENSIYLPVLYACGLITTSAIALYILAPEFVVTLSEGGLIPRLSGLTGSPNNLGRVASLALLFSFFAVQRRIISFAHPAILLIVATSILCLGLSWSRTSAAALIVAVIAIQLRNKPGAILVGLAASATLFLGLLLSDFNWNTLVQMISRRGSIDELLTFTGRTAIWEYNWQKFLEQPLIGHGYGATKLLMPEEFRTSLGWTSTSAHNMILQALVTTGIIGTAFIILALFWQIKVFLLKPSDFPDAIFLYVLMTGLFEPGAVGVAPNLFSLIWVLSLAMPRDKHISQNELLTTTQSKHI